MKATWIQADGTAITLTVKPGATLMEAEASRQPTSRLSCQITMSADLKGIILQVPAS